MRGSEGLQASAPACGHQCWRIRTQARNPALAVAENVMCNQKYCPSVQISNATLLDNKLQYEEI